MRPAAGEVVVEIGPGRGALTEVLLAFVDRLVAVEIDRDLVALLRARQDACRLRLIEGDILQVDLGEILRDAGGYRLLIVGNLPYNITAPLIFHLIAHAGCISRAIVMVQREVAQRLIASPGSKDYSLLSVLVAMRAEVEMHLQVGRDCFRPVPAVDSAVVELRFAPKPRYAVKDVSCFDRLVRRAFGQRRKMLRNSLLGLNPEGGRPWLEELGPAGGYRINASPGGIVDRGIRPVGRRLLALGQGGAVKPVLWHVAWLVLAAWTAADAQQYSLNFSRHSTRTSWNHSFPSWSYSTPVRFSAVGDSTSKLTINASANMGFTLDDRSGGKSWQDNASGRSSVNYPILGPKATISLGASMSTRNLTLQKQKTRSQSFNFGFRSKPLSSGPFKSLSANLTPSLITATRASRASLDSTIKETGIRYNASLRVSPDMLYDEIYFGVIPVSVG